MRCGVAIFDGKGSIFHEKNRQNDMYFLRIHNKFIITWYNIKKVKSQIVSQCDAGERIYHFYD